MESAIRGYEVFWAALTLTWGRSDSSFFLYWLPNLILPIGVYCLWTSRPGIAAGFGGVSLTLGFISVLTSLSPALIGVYAWLGSMVMLVASGLTLWHRKEILRASLQGPGGG